MIKSLSIYLLFILIGVGAYANTAPQAEDHQFAEMNLRYMKKKGDFRYIYEISGRNGFNNNFENHFKLGANYRLNSNFKLGLHLKLQSNTRYDDDWVQVPPLGWRWRSSASYDSVVINEIIYRSMLNDLLRAELRFRYQFNLANGHQVLKARPSLNYFWLRNGRAFLNLFTMYEFYRPTNFGNYEQYQGWLYFGGLYHLDKNNKIGISLAIGEWIWTTSRNFRNVSPSQTYQVNERANVISLNYTFTH